MRIGTDAELTVTDATLLCTVVAPVAEILAVLLIVLPAAAFAATVAWKVTLPEPPADSVPSDQVSVLVAAAKLPPPVALPAT